MLVIYLYTCVHEWHTKRWNVIEIEEEESEIKTVWRLITSQKALYLPSLSTTSRTFLLSPKTKSDCKLNAIINFEGEKEFSRNGCNEYGLFLHCNEETNEEFNCSSKRRKKKKKKEKKCASELLFMICCNISIQSHAAGNKKRGEKTEEVSPLRHSNSW